MPIYEFYCPQCHRIFNFLSRRVDTEGRPYCPQCGRKDLKRRASAFAISKNRPEPGEGAGESPEFDESRLERVLGSLGDEAEGLSEENPREAARLMRRVFQEAGMPMGSGMAEALRRMEAGEDPEKVEEEMGDLIDDPGGLEESAGRKFRRWSRRWAPPSVDPDLYEMESREP